MWSRVSRGAIKNLPIFTKNQVRFQEILFLRIVKHIKTYMKINKICRLFGNKYATINVKEL